MSNVATISSILSTDNATAAATLLNTPSNKVSILGNMVLINGTTVQIVGASSGSFVQTAPITAAIQPSQTKVLVDSNAVLLQGDKTAQTTITLTDASSGATMTLPVTAEIANANQTKVSVS